MMRKAGYKVASSRFLKVALLRKKIVILSRYFYPGHKAGGPIQSLKGVVKNLASHYDICAITSDRDSGDTVPYADIQHGTWNTVLDIPVRYTSLSLKGLVDICRAIRQSDPDLYYINSFVDPVYSIFIQLLWHLGIIPRKPIVIAPRGELSLLSWRKWIYLLFYKWTNWQKPVFFQALNAWEIENMQLQFPQKKKDTDIFVVNNISLIGQCVVSRQHYKTGGSTKLIYLARIHPIKNLLLALGWLQQVRGAVQLDIYGLIEDAAYWRACQLEIAKMPASIAVSYKGVIPHDAVMQCLLHYEFCLQPSQTEAASNSLIEALATGLPVLASNRVGMDISSHNAGWSLPLSDTSGFVAALQKCVDMEDEEYQKMSEAARGFAAQLLNKEEAAARHAAMFDAAIASGATK